jgi:hypothetical protein
MIYKCLNFLDYDQWENKYYLNKVVERVSFEFDELFEVREDLTNQCYLFIFITERLM